MGLELAVIPPLAAAAPEEKVTVCHIPPGNPAGAHVISVSPFALEARLAHGDPLDACAPNADCCDNPCSAEGIRASDCTWGRSSRKSEASIAV
jgi:hypothetical protein